MRIWLGKVVKKKKSKDIKLIKFNSQQKKTKNSNLKTHGNNTNAKQIISTRNSTESNESGAEPNINNPYKKCKNIFIYITLIHLFPIRLYPDSSKYKLLFRI